MKTCKFCEGDVDERLNMVELGAIVYIDGDGKLTLQDEDGGTTEAIILYCPMCGRRIKD